MKIRLSIGIYLLLTTLALDVIAGAVGQGFNNQYLGNSFSCPSLNVGNPVNVATGNKYQPVPLFTGSGEFPLEFTWHYNSRFYNEGSETYHGIWTHSYSHLAYLTPSTDGASTFYVLGPDGSERRYSGMQDINPEKFYVGSAFPTEPGQHLVKHGIYNNKQRVGGQKTHTLLSNSGDRFRVTYLMNCKSNTPYPVQCAYIGYDSIEIWRDEPSIKETYKVRDSSESGRFSADLVSLENEHGVRHKITRYNWGGSNRPHFMHVLRSNGSSLRIEYEESLGTGEKTNLGKYGDLLGVQNIFANPVGENEIIWEHLYQSGLLTRISWSRGSSRREHRHLFHYDFEPNSSTAQNWNYATALTGYTLGTHIAGWLYDNSGRVFRSYHGPDEASKYYGSAPFPDDTMTMSQEISNLDNYNRRTVTDIYGKSTTYQFELSDNIPRLVSVSGNQTANCLPGTSNYTYENRNVKTITDAKGVITEFSNFEFSNNKPKTVVYAKGTEDQVITGKYWNSELITGGYSYNRGFPLLVQESFPRLTLHYEYEDNNRLKTIRQEADQAEDRIYRIATTYHDSEKRRIKARVITADDGSHHDRREITSTYDKRGNLTQVTSGTTLLKDDEVSLTTYYRDYNAWGNPETIIAPTGTKTKIRYLDSVSRQFIESITEEGSNGYHFEYTHSNEILIKKITYPNLSWIEFYYTWGGDIKYLKNNLGERMNIDTNRSDQVKTDVISYLNADGNAVYHANRISDGLDRLYKSTRGRGDGKVSLEYNYDVNGNHEFYKEHGLDSNGLPLELTVASTFNSNNVLSSVSAPDAGTTKFGTDTQQNIDSVTDALSRETEYTYNGFGELIREESPDTGIRTYNYKNALLIEEIHDSTGTNAQTIRYGYNNHGDLKTVMFVEANKQQEYFYNHQYDINSGEPVADSYSLGKLTRVKNNDADIFYSYNKSGQIVKQRERYTGSDRVYTTEYLYNSATHDLTGMVYPSGVTLSYGLDALGRIQSIQYQLPNSSSQAALITNVTYHPFGSIKQIRFANGVSQDFSLTDGYQMDEIIVNPNVMSMDYGYSQKHFGNVASIRYQAQIQGAPRTVTETFKYDNAHRLKMASGTYGERIYGYNLIGDRDHIRVDGELVNYQFSEDRKTLSAGGNSVYQFDDQGFLRASSDYRFDYNAANRLSSVKNKSGSVIAQYYYNAFGQRTLKRRLDDSTSVQFHYDIDGHLISKHGQSTRDYIFIGDSLVAMLDSEISSSIKLGNVTARAGNEITHQRYYVHVNHLQTPVLITNDAKQPVWYGTYDPFGQVTTVVAQIENNVRFAGQYFDNESGLHYNWHRYYDPALGRYISSDRLGLFDGSNTYAYVHNNPLNEIDPTGEFGIVGAGIGAVIDLGFQLAANGGNFKCVNWSSVVTSAGMGAIGGGLANGLYKGAFKVWRPQQRKGLKHSFSGFKAWAKRNNVKAGIAKPSQQVHHSVAQQNQGWLVNLPNKYKNQPWQMNSVSPEFNRWMSRGATNWRSLLGAPPWMMGVSGGLGTMAVGGGMKVGGAGCGC